MVRPNQVQVFDLTQEMLDYKSGAYAQDILENTIPDLDSITRKFFESQSNAERLFHLCDFHFVSEVSMNMMLMINPNQDVKAVRANNIFASDRMYSICLAFANGSLSAEHLAKALDYYGTHTDREPEKIINALYRLFN